MILVKSFRPYKSLFKRYNLEFERFYKFIMKVQHKKFSQSKKDKNKIDGKDGHIIVRDKEINQYIDHKKGEENINTH